MSEESSRPLAAAAGIEDIVNRNGNKLFRAVVAITGNKAESEDIVQEVFVKLIEKGPRFESAEHESAWLIKVAVNLCKNRIRSHWWKKTESLLDTYPAQSSEESDIIQTVMTLPMKYRTVIYLFYYEGYSAKEIADITNRRESTVRQQLTRARRMLKEFLEGEF